MPEFVRIAAVSDVPENDMRSFEYNGQRIAVYNVAGTFYATDDLCSHAYVELTQGYLEPEDCTVECPLHGSRFDIRTGRVLSLPAYTPITTYPVKVEGDDLLIEM